VSDGVTFIIALLVFIFSVVVFIYGERKARRAENLSQDVRMASVKQRTVTRIFSMLGVILTLLISVLATGGISGNSPYRDINPGLILIIIPIISAVYLIRNFLNGVHEE